MSDNSQRESEAQGAALRQGVEFVLFGLRRVCTGGSSGLDEEGRGVLPHQALLGGLLSAVSLPVDRGGVRRPLAQPADGLQRSAEMPGF